MRPSERDLLGLRLGMGMAEAAKALTALDDVEAVLETGPVPDSDSAEGRSPLLGYQRIHLRRGGTEAITIASYAPDGPVLAIMRRMVNSDDVLPYDVVEAALRAKYGAEDASGMNEMESLGWGGAGVGNPAASCHAIPYGHVSITDLRRVEDGTAMSWSDADEQLQMTLGLSMPAYGKAVLAATEGCGETMTYVRRDGR